jgi:hypothetical protein
MRQRDVYGKTFSTVEIFYVQKKLFTLSVIKYHVIYLFIPTGYVEGTMHYLCSYYLTTS